MNKTARMRKCKTVFFQKFCQRRKEAGSSEDEETYRQLAVAMDSSRDGNHAYTILLHALELLSEKRMPTLVTNIVYDTLETICDEKLRGKFIKTAIKSLERHGEKESAADLLEYVSHKYERKAAYCKKMAHKYIEEATDLRSEEKDIRERATLRNLSR